MRSLRHYLVRIPNRFKETIKVGDKELYLDAKFNEFEYRFMEGEVIAIPEKFDFPVKKGDTLFGISQKYGLSVDTLKKINGLRSNDIQVGTSLKISIE